MVRKVVKSEPNEFATPWMHEERKVFLDLPMVITVTNKRVQEFESKKLGKAFKSKGLWFFFSKEEAKIRKAYFCKLFISSVWGLEGYDPFILKLHIAFLVHSIRI